MSIGRQLWVIVHRWAGLTLALFLIVAGATGALMPFYEELNAVAAPWRVVDPPSAGAHVLDPLTLRAKALAALPPGSRNDFISLDVPPDHTFDIFPELPDRLQLPYDYIALDPYTGAVVHRGKRADLGDGIGELLPFILQLHFSLALGPWGIWAFGVAAVIWTIDCLIGFYLTFPTAQRNWWMRWRRAWALRVPPPSRYRLNMDLHRAGGLWLWPVLFVFAWSSVAMNLRSVYDPVMDAIGLGEAKPSITTHALPAGYLPDWPAAIATGRRLTDERGRELGFTVARPGYIYLDAETGLFSYNFASSRDIVDTGTWSMLSFDREGRLAAMTLADGGLKNGGASVWLLALHVGQVGGLAYRIFVSLLGLMVVALSITGIAIWMKKRSARLLGQRRAFARGFHRADSPQPSRFADT